VNDETYEEVVAEIKMYMRGWVALLGLADWAILNVFHREEDLGETGARTTYDWPYMLATIEWNTPAIAESIEGVEAIVIHELVHILIADYKIGEPREEEDGRVMCSDGMERVATLLQKAFTRTKKYVNKEGLWDEEPAA
jgi:hypothetical protein